MSLENGGSQCVKLTKYFHKEYTLAFGELCGPLWLLLGKITFMMRLDCMVWFMLMGDVTLAAITETTILVPYL